MSNKQLLNKLNEALSLLSTSTVSLTRQNLQAIIKEIQEQETSRLNKLAERKANKDSGKTPLELLDEGKAKIVKDENNKYSIVRQG